jgi:hypothetical protein
VNCVSGIWSNSLYTLGTVSNDVSIASLRQEIAQSTSVNFPNLMNMTLIKFIFEIAQMAENSNLKSLIENSFSDLGNWNKRSWNFLSMTRKNDGIIDTVIGWKNN